MEALPIRKLRQQLKVVLPGLITKLRETECAN